MKDAGSLGRPALETTVAALIRAGMDDWELGDPAPIIAETRIRAHLGFDSLDMVRLISAIETHFDRPDLPFSHLLVRDSLYVQDLRFGELVDFLEKQGL